MAFFPPVPDTDFLPGQFAIIVKDYPIDGAFALNYGTIKETGARKIDKNLLAEGVSINGPAAFTIDMIAAKIPCDVAVTIRNLTGGWPGTRTTTTYNFGPSLTSASISLPNSNYDFTHLTVTRRF